VSVPDHAAAFQNVIDQLAGLYDPAPRGEEIEPIRQLVYSFLLWDSATNRADNAFKRLEETYVDMNDLRVSRTEEVMAVLGKTYPRADERVARIKASLRDVYLREHAVSLSSVASGGKREAKKYLDSLDGMHQFVAARVSLLALDSHAIPLEERVFAKLIKAEVFEPDSPIEKAVGSIERHVKATDGLQTYLLLQAWSEDNASDGSEFAGSAAKPKKKAASGKSTASKANGSRKKKSAKS
jgi:hypothetical protein